MNCPQCQKPLVMSDRQGIEIDFCSTCRGVWLDRGELDKIIERSAAYVSAERDVRPAQTRNLTGDGRENYRQGDYDGRRDDYRHGKKKSFWSELFD